MCAMRKIVDIPLGKIKPEKEAILHKIGNCATTNSMVKMVAASDEAMKLFETLCEPRGILTQVNLSDFEKILYGEGKNATKSSRGEDGGHGGNGANGKPI